jgi:ABC-type methionine transport system permease subunit
MSDRTPRPSLPFVLAAVVGGGGLGLFAFAIGTNAGWVILGVATILVVVSICLAGFVERRRDRFLG